MSSAAVLAGIAGALGGGGLAGLVQVVKARGDLRNTDAHTDQIEAAVSAAVIANATTEAKRQVDRNEQLERRLDLANARVAKFADELELLHGELRTARRRIAALEEHLETHPTVPLARPRDPSTRSRQDDR